MKRHLNCFKMLIILGDLCKNCIKLVHSGQENFFMQCIFNKAQRNIIYNLCMYVCLNTVSHLYSSRFQQWSGHNMKERIWKMCVVECSISFHSCQFIYFFFPEISMPAALKKHIVPRTACRPRTAAAALGLSIWQLLQLHNAHHAWECDNTGHSCVFFARSA
jgi:hypothetical protein